MMRRLKCYVMYDPHTGVIIQCGEGIAHPRDGLLIGEVLVREHREIHGHREKVDLGNVIERGDEPRIVTLIETFEVLEDE